MPTTFLNLENNATSSLRAVHSVGDGKIQVQSSDGTKFGATFPARVTLVHATSGATAIYRVSARSGDDLTIAAVLESTADISFPVGSAVEMRWTKGAKVDIEGAVNALESAQGAGGGSAAGSAGQVQVSSGSGFAAIRGTSVGTDAVAIGLAAVAAGQGSLAVDGDDPATFPSLAAGRGSIVAGSQAVASGDTSAAFGNQSVAGFPPVHCSIAGATVTVDAAYGDVTARFPVSDPIPVVLHRLAGGTGATAAAGIATAAAYNGTNTVLTLQSSVTNHTAGYASSPDATNNCLAAGGASVASGNDSTALGNFSYAPAAHGLAVGYGGYADVAGKLAIGGGSFSTYAGWQGTSTGFAVPGDTQKSTVVLGGTTADASPTVITGPSVAALPVRPGIGYAFDLTIAARKTDGTKFARFKRSGYVHNQGGTTALEGAVQTIGTDINTPGWSVSVAADDALDGLAITVTGEATVHWVAALDCVEVG